MPAVPPEITHSTSQNEKNWGAEVAGHLGQAVRSSMDRSGSCHLALSGGSTPAPVYQALARFDLPWKSIHIWQTDERVVTEENDRAWHTVEEFLVTGCALPPENLHPFVIDGTEPERIAARYAEALRARLGGRALDVVFLGLGRDGHTASIFDPRPEADDPGSTARALGPYEGTWRVTLTEPFLSRSRHRMVVASGAGKADAVRALLGALVATAPLAEIPRRILGKDGLLLTDAAAAGHEGGT